MKLYKYRDLRDPNQGLALTAHILQSQSFWCARPDTLNDPEEFAWSCNYVSSPGTEGLLAEQIVRLKGRSWSQARILVAAAVTDGGLRRIAEPVVNSVIQQCRDSYGLACFGTTPANDVLWQRYAGGGNGLCVEVEVPDGLIGTQLYEVRYRERKLLHIDTFLRSTADQAAADEVYSVTLLTKPLKWAPEAEFRFLSKRQGVSVAIEGSRITRVIMGQTVPLTVRAALSELAPSIPVTERSDATQAAVCGTMPPSVRGSFATLGCWSLSNK